MQQKPNRWTNICHRDRLYFQRGLLGKERLGRGLSGMRNCGEIHPKYGRAVPIALCIARSDNPPPQSSPQGFCSLFKSAVARDTVLWPKQVRRDAVPENVAGHPASASGFRRSSLGKRGVCRGGLPLTAFCFERELSGKISKQFYSPVNSVLDAVPQRP